MFKACHSRRFAILSAITNDKKNTPASLASFIGIDGAAITRHLDRLDKQALLVRERSTTDRRSVNLKMTRKGSRLVPKLVADSKATNAKFLAGLTLAEKKGFQGDHSKDAGQQRSSPGRYLEIRTCQREMPVFPTLIGEIVK